MGEHISTFAFYTAELDANTNRYAAAKENAARPAVAEITYRTTGVGQKRVTAALEFPVIFRNEPHFTNGSGVIKNPDPDNWHDPIGTVGVYRWQRTKKGYFTGAYIFWRVETSLTDDADFYASGQPPAMKVEHFLTFSGTAFKNLDKSSMDRTMTPRTPGTP